MYSKIKKQQYAKILILSKRLKSIKYLGGSCKSCKDDKWYHLDFHHIREKDFEVSRLLQGFRWSKIEKELDKCILLCANCHQEHHFNKRSSSDNRQVSKRVYLSYKNNSCEECGYNKCQASLTFHHIDPSVKEIQFSNLNERLGSLDDLSDILKEELNKCSLLCNNCHREKHIDFDFYNKNMDLIIKKSENLKELSPSVDVKVVIEMYNSGKKQFEIRKELGVAKSTISGIIKRYKLSNQNKPR
jgi:hypothetical protein